MPGTVPVHEPMTWAYFITGDYDRRHLSIFELLSQGHCVYLLFGIKLLIVVGLRYGPFNSNYAKIDAAADSEPQLQTPESILPSDEFAGGLFADTVNGAHGDAAARAEQEGSRASSLGFAVLVSFMFLAKLPMHMDLICKAATDKTFKELWAETYGDE